MVHDKRNIEQIKNQLETLMIILKKKKDSLTDSAEDVLA